LFSSEHTRIPGAPFLTASFAVKGGLTNACTTRSSLYALYQSLHVVTAPTHAGGRPDLTFETWALFVRTTTLQLGQPLPGSKF